MRNELVTATWKLVLNFFYKQLPPPHTQVSLTDSRRSHEQPGMTPLQTGQQEQ